MSRTNNPVLYYERTLRTAVRNVKVCEKKATGLSLRKVGEHFNISGQRVKMIVDKGVGYWAEKVSERTAKLYQANEDHRLMLLSMKEGCVLCGRAWE